MENENKIDKHLFWSNFEPSKNYRVITPNCTPQTTYGQLILKEQIEDGVKRLM